MTPLVTISVVSTVVFTLVPYLGHTKQFSEYSQVRNKKHTVAAESGGESAVFFFTSYIPLPSIPSHPSPSLPIPSHPSPSLCGNNVRVLNTLPDGLFCKTPIIGEGGFPSLPFPKGEVGTGKHYDWHLFVKCVFERRGQKEGQVALEKAL